MAKPIQSESMNHFNQCLSAIKRLSYLFVILLSLSCFLSVASAQTVDEQDPSYSKETINQGAKQQKDNSDKGQMVNQMVGAAFMGICMGCPKCQPWACPMAGLSFAQSGSHGGDAGQAATVDWDTSPYNTNYENPYDNNGSYSVPVSGDLGYGGGDGTGPSGTGGPGSGYGTIDGNLKKLEEMGYKVNVDKGTISTPDGEVPIDSFNSPEGMAAAGLSPSQISAAQKKLGEINKKAMKEWEKDRPNVVSMGLDAGGGGGGGYGPGGGFSADDREPSSYSSYLDALKKKLGKKNAKKVVAGKARMVSGEPIGVAVDNIFEMVHRRYQVKRKANEFIEGNVKTRRRRPASR